MTTPYLHMLTLFAAQFWYIRSRVVCSFLFAFRVSRFVGKFIFLRACILFQHHIPLEESEHKSAQGKDPITGSWFGELLGMEAAQGCLCILTSQMMLHVYDVHQEACRQISLAVGSSLRDRSAYAAGRPLLQVPDSKGGCVCAYDVRNALHLSIWPADGFVDSLRIRPPSSPGEHSQVLCAGLFADLPLAIYYADGGREILLVRCGLFDHNASAAAVRLGPDLLLSCTRSPE